MKPFFLLLGLILGLPLTGYSAQKYAPSTLRLSQHHGYLEKARATDFWKLIPYYVSQKDGSACGIASLSMLLNALRSETELTAKNQLITQQYLLQRVKIFYRKGLTLDQLSEAILKAMKEFSIRAKVEVIHADGTEETRKKIRKVLETNESSTKNFLIANFQQGKYTGDPEGGGHISPVGAYDASSDRVLILDVDREYYEPYWVSTSVFIQGMETPDSVSKKNRGMIWVELE